jgi:hypothetical protein
MVRLFPAGRAVSPAPLKKALPVKMNGSTENGGACASTEDLWPILNDRKFICADTIVHSERFESIERSRNNKEIISGALIAVPLSVTVGLKLFCSPATEEVGGVTVPSTLVSSTEYGHRTISAWRTVHPCSQVQREC